MRTSQLVVALCLLFTSVSVRSAAAQQPTVKLVTIESGDLPIILSAPHGGGETIPGVPARRGAGIDSFKTRSDSFTAQLTEKLAAALQKKLGSRPYTVIARFHRKYVDANRPRKLAYESEAAKAVYDTYHLALAAARRDVIRRWGHGMLLDIHGQGVGVYVDEGAGASVKDLLLALGKFENVSIKRLKADDIRSGGLADLDVLIQPGGSGGGQGRRIGEDGREAIRGFVQNGGGFIGICAGSYLASADYSWSLHILDAKVVDREHWNRGKGTVDIAITDTGQKLLRTEAQKLAIHYAQGPLLAPGNRPDIDDYEVMATFETEIAKNGAPAGVMKGTTAIARGKFGSGRVVCFSPHPELTKGLEPLVQYAIEHVKRNRLRRVVE